MSTVRISVLNLSSSVTQLDSIFYIYRLSKYDNDNFSSSSTATHIHAFSRSQDEGQGRDASRRLTTLRLGMLHILDNKWTQSCNCRSHITSAIGIITYLIYKNHIQYYYFGFLSRGQRAADSSVLCCRYINHASVILPSIISHVSGVIFTHKCH